MASRVKARTPRKDETRTRAEREEDARRRIARAVHELHATVGPAATTAEAVAQQAGVNRATVCRHFPDELSLYRACLACWTTERPLPDELVWARIQDPLQRLATALVEVYGHYERNEGLWANRWRDLPRLPELLEADEPVVAHFERMRVVLRLGWPAQVDQRLLAAGLGHALEFPTWHTFVRRQGLTTVETIEVVISSLAWLTGVARPALAVLSDGEPAGA